ncbi:MAG: lycopene cyclase domain-containing protein [Bacteroidota bacterium]
MKSLYLLVNFFTVIVPFVFSFHPKLKFNKEFKYFFLANFLVAFTFITSDIFFTKLEVWGFNPEYVTGLYLVNLPIEEVLFFICIPFACVFTYHCLNLFIKPSWKPQTENIIILSLSIPLLVTGILFIDKLYTSFTFISLGILLLLFKYVLKLDWLPKLLGMYAILLIPFFIVNGILTGTWIDNPVVWYNNDENLGIRLMTIPVEDVFYGFELILLNVCLYEYFKSNRLKTRK